jgi:3-methyladenine DNA glycosylase AlkD
MKTLTDDLRQRLSEKANEENSEQMSRYLKNHFIFFGIKTPERREISKLFFQETGILKKPYNEEFVLALWEQPEREFQLLGLDYIAKFQKKLTKHHIAHIEKLITTKSWWDTVDMLAQHPAGTIIANHPELIEDLVDKWAVSEDMWLRRTAIIHQLRYKEKTNEDRLYKYIKQNADSKEFFIQKGIGWALREYSKTNPYSVKQFIESTSLAPLSMREGSKYIPKE